MIQDWKVCYRMQCVAPCRIWDEDVCKSLRSRLVLEHRFLRFLISSVLINAFKSSEFIWKSKGDVTLLYNGINTSTNFLKDYHRQCRGRLSVSPNKDC